MAAGRSPEEQAVFEHVQRLGRLRAQQPELRQGAMVNLLVAEQAWAFARVLNDQVAIVALNNGPAAAEIAFEVAALGLAEGAELVDRLGTLPPPARVVGGRLTLELPPRSGAILTPRG